MALHLEVLDLRDKVHELKQEKGRLTESNTQLRQLLDQKTAYAESLELERDRLKVAIEHAVRSPS